MAFKGERTSRAVKNLTVLAGVVLMLGGWSVSAQTAPAQPQDPTAQGVPSTATPNSRAVPSAKHTDEAQPAETASASAPSSSSHRKDRPFMGRVIKANSGYVLRAGDLEFKLDDQDKARDYAGKNVKVLGNLDRQSNTIHVKTIEPSM